MFKQMTRKSAIVILFSVCASFAAAQECSPVLAVPGAPECGVCCVPGVCSSVASSSVPNPSVAIACEQTPIVMLDSSLCADCAQSEIQDSGVPAAYDSGASVRDRRCRIGSRVRNRGSRVSRLCSRLRSRRGMLGLNLRIGRRS